MGGWNIFGSSGAAVAPLALAMVVGVLLPTTVDADTDAGPDPVRHGECDAGALISAGEVTEILDGQTLALSSGLTVRLAGAAVPPTGPIALQARTLLDKLALNRAVLVGRNRPAPDRYGRVSAHVFVSGDAGLQWVQGALVSAGLARTYSLKDDRACIESLLAREARARSGGKGLWRQQAFAVRAASRPDEMLGLADTFQIVEGEIHSTGRTKARVYLNFGPRWKTDFTGMIKIADLKRFDAKGLIPERLSGRKVRVRGWLEEQNGPMLVLTHPEQIELLDGADE